jgi:hypothetical protein
VPYHHKDSHRFLSAIKKKYLDQKSLIINLGDEIDGNQISMHDKDPDMPFSPCKEFEESIKALKPFYKLFPKMYLCESNHGSLVYRRAKKFGIPLALIKSYQEILETPNWEWHEDILLTTNMGDVYICHGKTATSGKLAKEQGASAIQGHFHGKFQLLWFKTSTTERFDCYSGCLVDRDNLAFSYGKNHLPKPILGATLLSKSGYPSLIKMNLKSDLRS